MIPYSYSLRHIQKKPITALLTLLGVAFVVGIYSSTLMLEEGLKTTLKSTGSPENIMIIRTGAENEIQSGVLRDHAAIVSAYEGIKSVDASSNESTKDLLVLLSLKRKSDNQRSNVSIRGTTPMAKTLRESFKLIEGRLPSPGTQEVMVGKAIYDRFIGTTIGSNLRLAGTDWPVVGIFDAGNSAFSSEVWGDVDIMMSVFKRERFSSITFRRNPTYSFERIKNELENDKRLSVTVYKEPDFYEKQSKGLGIFIKYLGTFVSVIFSLAAIIGCAVTMYSSIAQRQRENGILRALGFKKISIVAMFMRESIILSIAGAIVGLALSSLLSFTSFSTTNFQTFSDLTFNFKVNFNIIFKSILFATIMGFVGAVIPVWRATRKTIVGMLR